MKVLLIINICLISHLYIFYIFKENVIMAIKMEQDLRLSDNIKILHTYQVINEIKFKTKFLIFLIKYKIILGKWKDGFLESVGLKLNKFGFI